MTRDDPGEHVAQVRLRIDPVHLAGFDERGDDRPMLAAAVRAARGSGSRPRRQPACQNPVKAQKFVPPQKLSEESRLTRGEAMDAVTGGPVPQQSALPQQATAVTPFTDRCYLINYTPANSTSFAYAGTLQVELTTG